MKTYRNLYPQIAGFANLDEAWRKARRGKRTKEAAARFEANAPCAGWFQPVSRGSGGFEPAGGLRDRLLAAQRLPLPLHFQPLLFQRQPLFLQRQPLALQGDDVLLVEPRLVARAPDL